MSTEIYTQDSEAIRIVSAAFPGLPTKQIRIVPFRPMRLDSNWSGGSKDSFVLIDLETFKHAAIPENGTPFSSAPYHIDKLPTNIVVVEHTIFCGKNLGFRIYVNSENLGKYLPAPINLTDDELNVLCCTSRYTSVARLKYSGISQEKWNSVKETLISKGLLKKNGAITDDGRNSIVNVSVMEVQKRLFGGNYYFL